MNLKKLYQQVLLDHNKKPRNFKIMDDPSHYAHGVNPLCGDDYHLFLQIDDDQIIQDISFHGEGCAISKSVSSMMTSSIKGKTVEEAKTLTQTFIQMVTTDDTIQDPSILGHLTIFENVKEFPIRVKCATLIWRALEASVTKKVHKISSEEID